MKNKNIILLIISILSLIFMILNISINFFYVFAFLLISITAFYGFSGENEVWYHKSAHIMVSSLLGIFTMAYELLGILFSLISSELSNIKPNIYVIIFGIISIVIFIEELNYLRKIEQEAKRKKSL
jgi:phosphatidylglycerophosphate synthase